jgi:hypothetical protein
MKGIAKKIYDNASTHLTVKSPYTENEEVGHREPQSTGCQDKSCHSTCAVVSIDSCKHREVNELYAQNGSTETFLYVVDSVPSVS